MNTYLIMYHSSDRCMLTVFVRHSGSKSTYLGKIPNAHDSRYWLKALLKEHKLLHLLSDEL